MKGRPFSWIMEEYAFGAVALKEEIKRHKETRGERWSIWKEVLIRLLYVYAVLGAIVLVTVGMISQIVKRFFDFRRKE